MAGSGRAHAAEPVGPLRLHVVYSLHADVQPGPDWPNVGFDFRPVMSRTTEALAGAFPEARFKVSKATGPEEAERLVEADKAEPPDGYIVYQLNCWNRVVQTLAATGKPVLYADFQYGGSGGFLVYTAAFLREQAGNVGFVASSDMEDHIAAVGCFGRTREVGASGFGAAVAQVRRSRTKAPDASGCLEDAARTVSAPECIERLKGSRILALRDTSSGMAEPYMGVIPLEMVSFAEVNAAWEAADREASRAVADRWERTATGVDGVSRETLETSAAFYLGMKDVLAKHGANAITINCLGGFYGGHIHAYPCLGFHELCNEGLVGACECDIRSTATMLTLSTLTGGRTGFISDPVIDTAKGQIIYAHCVAPNRAFGPEGPANPFQIMTHSEDRQGASLRSVLPLGYMTTTIELGPERKEILFHQGKAVANDPDDRACRTKLGVEPKGDLEKLFTMWDTYGWHRVTAYGDLRGPVFALADALGYTVYEEA